MAYVTTPNMNLQVPIVGQTIGPDYAFEVNTSLGTIDSHNHVPGNGVAITPSGLNINADLQINANNLTLVNTVRFNPIGSPLTPASPNITCVYVSGNELYYNDGTNHTVKITSNGSVNSGAGNIGGLPNGAASVDYVGLTASYVFQSAVATVNATVDVANVILRNSIPSSLGLTLAAPTLGSNIQITLPNPPTGAIGAVLMDNTGTMSVSVAQYQAFCPIGSIIPYSGQTAPAGWLISNGAAVSRSTYPNLFALYNSMSPPLPYGNGDGTTTFNIPNLTDSAPFGVGNRFSIGQTGGFLDPSFNTMVSHDHNFSQSQHDHGTQSGTLFVNTAGGAGNYAGGGSGGSNPRTGVSNANINFNAQGNSTTNGNMPPFIGMVYIVKT